MNIDRKARGTPAPTADQPESPPGEWCVRVSVSVTENVPAPILRTWIIVESFARDQASCWPGNKALAARLGVNRRAAQLTLESLEDHGLIERRTLGGNRRAIVLIRRTAEPLPRVEWKALAARAGRRASGRIALTAETKAKKAAARPKLRIIS